MNINIKSKKLLLISGLFLSATACQNMPPAFTHMSDEELFAYNNNKPYLDRVICVREATTSSYIRKRKCLTFEEMIYHNERTGMTLDVLNSAPVFSFPGSIND